ncbi:MAG: hypothetical protein ACI95X_003101 [Paraglaciecola sp.]|jgi:hypothetical protein
MNGISTRVFGDRVTIADMTLHGFCCRQERQTTLHIVSANAVVVRRLKTVAKSKEITAISY